MFLLLGKQRERPADRVFPALCGGGTRFGICNHCEMGHWRNGGDCEFHHVNTGYQSGYWRVKIAWPEVSPRYFGKFRSREEAEKWIEKHCWLTKQTQEPDEP